MIHTFKSISKKYKQLIQTDVIMAWENKHCMKTQKYWKMQAYLQDSVDWISRFVNENKYMWFWTQFRFRKLKQEVNSKQGKRLKIRLWLEP